MELKDIRIMGEALSRARELCQQSDLVRGMELYQNNLNKLRQYIRRMAIMSERQPWLQMQIDLENEYNLIADYADLLQSIKTIPDSQRKCNNTENTASIRHVADTESQHVNPFQQKYQIDAAGGPNWEIRVANTRNPEPINSSEDPDYDPDVWAPPSPIHSVQRRRPNFQQRAPPSWASEKSGKKAPVARTRATGKNNHHDSEQAGGGRKPAANRQPVRSTEKKSSAKPKNQLDYHPGEKGHAVGLKAARRGNEKVSKALISGDKPKYADIAREEGCVDIELIEAIERDIVDSGQKVTFEHIAGLEHTKQLLQEAVMLPMIAPHLFKDGILKPCNGVLMFGPPGTGKTLLAKAVANVCNTTFFNVSASTLASKYRGESEKMVRILFEMARYYGPSIIFMDEIDAIAGSRGGPQEHESSRRVKTELLVQINGVSSGDGEDPGARVMVLAATNLPWELDEAMRRRLTKRVYIPLPEAEGRRKLFQLNLEKVDVAKDVDFDQLIAETEGFSGDDICGLCETAKMMPVKRLYTPEILQDLHRKQQEGASEMDLKSFEKSALEITKSDFKIALENVSKSVGQNELERYVKWEEEFGSK